MINNAVEENNTLANGWEFEIGEHYGVFDNKVTWNTVSSSQVMGYNKLPSIINYNIRGLVRLRKLNFIHKGIFQTFEAFFT